MNEDLQTKTNAVIFGLMRAVAYTFLFVYTVITMAAIMNGDRDILNSMKDATINIVMIVVGYVFGTSSSSRLKDLKPEPKKEF
jgi:fructose-specific phosphotransferase system IIC component